MAFFRRLQRLPNRLKITYSLIALVVIVGMGLFIWSVVTGKIKPLAAAEEASLSIRTTSPINIGQTFTMFVTLSSTATSSGIASVSINGLNYDQTKLEVKAINPDSTDIWNVTTSTFDSSTGKINYSALAKDPAGFKGSTSQLMNVEISALASGEARIWFDYTSSPGDTDVLLTDGSDILVSAPTYFVTVNSEVIPGSSSTPTPNLTPTACKKGCSPTPVVPSPEVTSEATPIIEEGTPEVGDNQPTPAQVVQATPVFTPSPLESVVSPEPSESPFPELSPTSSPLTTFAGFSISKPVAIVFYILIPILVVGIVFLIWWLKRRKSGATGEKNQDADEIDLDEEP